MSDDDFAALAADSLGDYQPMTAAEFRMVRDWLGVPAEWLAGHLGVALRTIRRWESGRYEIPDGKAELVEQLEARASATVEALVAHLADAPVTSISIPTPDAGEVEGFPPGWHRMIAARVAQEVPGLTVRYLE